MEPLSPTLSSPASQAPRCCPQGNPEDPLTLAASLPFRSSRRGRAPTPQPVPPRGPVLGCWGNVEMGRKASPSPTLGWKNQRGSIPQKWGGGPAEECGDAKRPVRDKTERPRKGDPEMGVGAPENPEEEHRGPGREDRETEEGKQRQPLRLRRGEGEVNLGGSDTGRQRYRGVEGQRPRHRRKERTKRRQTNVGTAMRTGAHRDGTGRDGTRATE